MKSRQSASDNSPRKWAAMARGLALFLGAFALTNLAGKWTLGFDANLWWIDLRAFPVALADGLVFLFSLLLIWFAVKPRSSRFRRLATATVAALFGLIAFSNSLVFWLLLAQGAITTASPIPVAAGVAASCWFIAAISRKAGPTHSVGLCPVLLAAGVCAGAFPLVQAHGFGKTDYRRRSDVAVVFGARVYADGRLSDAVADRVRTAAQLYRQGLVRELVMSGGPGDGMIHETEAMREYAVNLGVPALVIQLDPDGLNTAATVRNVLPNLAGKRVIAVSEFYHLPRIKFTFASFGCEVFTVPAQPAHWSRAWSLRSTAREVPAFWAYYLRSIGGILRLGPVSQA